MIEDECGETCCNHGCNQGRNCPARQACELPDNVPSNFGIALEWFTSLVISWVVVGAISVAVLLVVANVF